MLWVAWRNLSNLWSSLIQQVNNCTCLTLTAHQCFFLKVSRWWCHHRFISQKSREWQTRQGQGRFLRGVIPSLRWVSVKGTVVWIEYRSCSGGGMVQVVNCWPLPHFIEKEYKGRPGEIHSRLSSWSGQCLNHSVGTRTTALWTDSEHKHSL